MVILSGNPLKVDRMAIKDIKVLETIKERTTVYMRKQAAAAALPPRCRSASARAASFGATAFACGWLAQP